MFMTYYEQVYGKNAGQSSEYTGPYYSEEEKKKGEFLKKAGAAAVAAGQLAGNAASSAAGTAKVLAGNAADYLKSDDAKAKMNAAKGKAQALASGAGSAFSGLKGKAAAFVNDLKKTAEESAGEADGIVTYNDIPEDISDKEIIDNINIESGSSILPEADNVPDMTDDDNIEIQEAEDDSSPAPTVQRLPEPKQPAVNTPMDTPTSYSYQEEKKSPIVYILIGIIALLLVVVGVLGGMFLMKNKDDKSDKNESAVSDDAAVTETSLLTSETITTESVDSVTSETANTPTEAHLENKIESITITSCDKDEVNSKYLDIVNNMDFAIPHRGFLTDLNGDGVNEMMVPEVSGMTYRLYYYDSGSIKSCSFGGFMALDNFAISVVDGENGEKYIYYRDNYSYKSCQGYFSLNEMSEIDILLNFPSAGSGTAEWNITYNGVEKFAEGTDNVENVYGETKQCYSKILEAFRQYNFDISDSSKYNSIDGLYYDDLVKSLGGVSATAPVPSITAELKAESALQGVDVFLIVSGTYSYYTYSCHEYDAGGGAPYTTNGNSSDGKIRVTGFSGGVSKVIVDVTPYNSDGVAGDTVTVTYVPDFGSANNSAAITPVEKYGTIYSPAGSKVDGYARSYLIDGGAEAYVRHDLTHGWHIKAVNEYNNGIFNYYELYDADDGDYYGWVNEEQISFY